jgi:drug/metabolite transporter (DMT)-like permease
MGNHSRSHIALLAAGLIFGANYWIAKGLMPVWFTPAQILFLRVGTATALFWLAGLLYSKDKVAKKELVRIALCSLLGVVINQYFFFEGLRLTRPVEASILHTTSPIFVMLFAAGIIGEKITIPKVSGIVLGSIGALAIVVKPDGFAFSTDTFLGNIFILINILSYSLYLVLVKPVMMKHNPIVVIKWAFLFGFLFSTPFTISSIAAIEWQAIPSNIWFSLTYVVIGSTFLAYLLTISALKYLSAMVVGFYIYLQPLLAASIGWLFYAEQPTLIKGIAACLIFSGVYLVNRPSRQPNINDGMVPGANP